MSPRQRAVLRLLPLAAALLLSVPLLRVGAHVWKELHPPRVGVTAEDRTRAEHALGRLEDVELTTADGVRLRGWFAPGAGRSAVVLVHGLGANRMQLLDEAAVLVRHGHGALLLDARASGESGGTLATWGDRERLDLAAALDWLAARPDVDRARLGVLGFSVGSTAAALAAVEDGRLRAVALGPIWPSLDEELGDKFPGWRGPVARLWFRLAGVDAAALRPVDLVGRLADRRVLFFHGSLDPDTPAPVMERVVSRLPSAAHWIVQGAGHGGFGAVDPEGLDRHLGAFFDQALPWPEPR